MKKMLSLISALTMCAVMAAPVASFAADFTNTTGESTVKCKKFTSSSYIVTIPDGVADLKDAKELEVSATNVVIGAKQELNISVTSANNFSLVNTEAEEGKDPAKIAYTLTPVAKEADASEDTEGEVENTEGKDGDTEKEAPKPLINGDSIISIAPEEAYNKTVTQKLIAASTDTAKVAGTYVDKLTFTVSVDGENVTEMSDKDVTEHFGETYVEPTSEPVTEPGA